MPDLPTGTVTLLFTDVEGSTRLLHELGRQAYADALAEHRRLVRDACASHGGVEVDTQGDAFFFAFPTAPGALAAAQTFTEALSAGPVHVRVGLHTGTPLVADEGYVGDDVHRAARIAGAGHGGQVLVSLSTATLVELKLTDLGEHRLKDLSAPERIYQLGEGGFPALKSLYRTNLPVPATPFLGREQELAEVLSLLSSEDTRLLTLTGPGGTGKTRLALQAVAEASDCYPDGVWWIPLAPVRQAELVLATAAQAVGSRNGLAEHISDKQMLCLFDNFEQVVEAGTELADLLAACPNLDVLVTSRERLRVRGEQTYPVPPLAEQDGVALFNARARAVDPSYAASDAVAELCLRLDSLPLALELAAARTALFSPEQLLDRLSERLDLLKGERDADPRQQTLRATIEWSYDLLTNEEQELFARLSVFVGGCSYEAAEQVGGADPDTLQSLLDKSLLRKRESELGPRYWMLETIREFASELRATLADADDLARRHAEHFLRLALDAEPALNAPDQVEWLDRLDAEHANLRSALDWSLTSDPAAGLRLAVSLRRYWEIRGHLLEAWNYLSALNAFDHPPELRVVALRDLFSFATDLDELDEGERFAEERLRLCRELGDEDGANRALQNLGLVALGRGDLDGAKAVFQEVLAKARELGADIDVPLGNLAEIAWEQGRLADAEALYEEVLALREPSGNRSVIAGVCLYLASIRLQQARRDRALASLRRAFTLTTPLRSPGQMSYALEVAAYAARDARNSAVLLGQADELFEQTGERWPRPSHSAYALAASAALEQLGEADYAAEHAKGRLLPLDQAIALALEVIDA